MTLHGIIVIDVIAIALLLWVLGLVRTGRLYVGYGVIFVLTASASMVLVSIPVLTSQFTRLSGAKYPASAFIMLALGFTAVIVVYTLSQVTIVSDRLARLTQELAIREALSRQRNDVDPLPRN